MRADHPDSFDPGVETGYLRRGSRDHDLPVEIGAAPFDPGPEHYDGRRAKRERRRQEKAERKRRARIEKLERKRREEAERRERERREAAERRERERAEKLEAERRERERAEAERRGRERRERLERERAERAARARAEDERRRRESDLQRQREERLRAERGRTERTEAERERLRREERERRKREREAREREERERERRKREAAIERRQRAELERRSAHEEARRELKLKPAPGKDGAPGPVRLKGVSASHRAPRPQVRQAPPASTSLRRPTVKAAIALAAVSACAAITGALLGLPVPLLSSSSDEAESATLAGDVALTGLLDAGTPPGLTRGPYFPVVLDAPADYGESAAKFHADRGGRKHEGLDVFAKPGTPLVAVRDGIVLDGAGGRNFYSTGGGHTLVIHSPIDDRSYVYLHMLKPALVKAGDRVAAGQPVGQVGCSGSCDGPHLHFEVRNGRAFWGAETKAVDPLPLLRQWPQRPTG